MKKLFKKISVLICTTLVMTFMLASTVLADGTDTSAFDFGQTVLTIKTGETATTSIYSAKNFICYAQGNTSSKTFAEITGKSGSSKVTYHIGADEQSSNVTFWFYWEETDTDHHDNVNVRVVKSSAATTNTVATATTSNVTFSDGTVGVISTESNNQILFVKDAAGTPLAAIALMGANGQVLTSSLMDTVSVNGISYITLATTNGQTPVSISISDTDKAAMNARGVGGIFVNNTYVLW